VFEHKRPLYAFFLVAVICGIVVGTTLRSQALFGLVQPWAGTSGIVAGKMFAPAEASEPSPFAPGHAATSGKARHGGDAQAGSGTSKHAAHPGHVRHQNNGSTSHEGHQYQADTSDQPNGQGHHHQPADQGDDGSQSDSDDQSTAADGLSVDPDTTSQITQLGIPGVPDESPDVQPDVQLDVQLDDQLDDQGLVAGD
jgi:hypothetical protein